MCKKAFSLIKKIDPLQGGDKILDKLGLPTVMGEKNGMFAEPEAPDLGSTTVEAPAAPPTAADPETMRAREDERRRRMAMSGMSSTILTGSSGLNDQASTGRKTLLGA